MKTSKKLAVMAMVSGLGLTAAQAGDLPNRKQAPEPVALTPVAPMIAQAPEEFSWTGFHLGVNAGVAKMHKPHEVRKDDANTKFPMAPMGGFQAGYDHQFGQFVLGAEADANFSTGAIVKEKVEKGAQKNREASLGRMFTVRARAGYAVDRALVYATGGWANLNLKPNKVAKADGTKTETRNGWTVGGGLEYALTDNLSARGEYLYVNMPKKAEKIVKEEKSSKATFSVVRAGLNYKF